MLLVAWLIGSFVAYSPFPEISGQVNHSAVLKAVDKVVPHDALSLPGFPPLRSLLTSGPTRRCSPPSGPRARWPSRPRTRPC